MRNPDTVSCCLNNVSFDVYRRYMAADVDIDTQHCLQRCGICHEAAFLVVDSDVVRDDSHADLLADLTQAEASESD